MTENSEEWQKRTMLLLNKQQAQQLASAHVLVAGLGGVGGYAVEQLCRAGIGRLTIVDGDVVHNSNRNRQIMAYSDNIGQAKTDAVSKRLMAINPRLQLHVIYDYLVDNTIEKLLSESYDYVVDAIDTIAPKIYLIKACMERKLKLVSSMGAGGRFNPAMVQVSDVSKSYNCRLAYYIRKRLRKEGIHKGFKVVFSSEPVPDDYVVETTGERNKKSVVGTISYMPAIFGCFCASVVIRDLIKPTGL